MALLTHAHKHITKQYKHLLLWLYTDIRTPVDRATLKATLGGNFNKKKKGREINHYKQILPFHTCFETRLLENVKHFDSSQYALEHTSHHATAQ